MPTPGLRERKKAATRAALSSAAVQLATQQGVEHVTVEEIAAAADVSTRTFFNHYASKEEAFVADDIDRGRRLLELVQEAEPDTDLWSLLERAALEALSEREAPSREQVLKKQLVQANPAVAALMLAAFNRLERELVEEIKERSGEGELSAHLMASSAVAAVRASVETWLRAEDADYPALLKEAFQRLRPAFTSREK